MTPKEEWQKKVRRILMDPDGRAALKEYGIEIEMVGKEQKPDDLPIVAILVPTYRAPEPQMSDSLKLMINHTRQAGTATVYTGAPIQASVVHWSRNMLITELLKSGKPWTHVLMIDDDMVLPEDALTKLLSHKKDIIGGICTRRQDPPVPTIRYYNEDTGVFDQIWEWPPNHTFEVGGIGTGFLLVSRHALEQIAQAYFDCAWEKDFYHVSDEWVAEHRARRMKRFDETKDCFWFRFLPAPSVAIEMGEDVAFCYVAKKYCGLQIFCDSSVQPGHIGNYDFGIKDFLPYQKLMIEEAKQNGKYHASKPLEQVSGPAPSFRVTYEEPVLA